ncbi:MAG TPA: efflux RND transporter periplasmic adaptor subunit [Terriglobia bacterium]|nr:efflux RND transporter periplasmic adaptor subunit [Terriglobia bacterium]
MGGDDVKTFAYTVALLGLLACCSCGRDSVPAAAAAPPELATVSAPAPTVDNRYTVSGPIVVENQVDVAAQREGVVAQILVDAGTRVRKGDLLAKLDDRQIVADLEAARAKTASTEADLNNWKAEAKVLEADYERAKKMWDAKLIPEEQFEHARYKAEGDQWDVKRVEQLLLNAQDTQRSLELELEKTQIHAPFDGIVARRYIRAGQTVVRGDRLMWVTATGPLRVRFTLPSKFVSQIKIGQPVAVTVADSNSTQEHTARIVQVSPVVDPASGTIEALAELTGSVADLRPGMQADVHLPAHP